MVLSSPSRFLITLAAVFTVGALIAPPAQAQYQGSNFKGDFGVNSGTQPGPGIYAVLPFGQWSTDSIKDADGDPFAADRFQGFDLRTVAPLVLGVTKAKFLGANYGFMVSVPAATVKPERVNENVDQTDWGLADLYVVPIYLGWHQPRADFIAGYGFFAPTGRYEVGADNNIGLGMWTQEVQGGVTAYLDAAKKISLATTAFVEFHSKKKDQDIKVGSLLTLEGGAAYNVPKIGGAFGVAYVAQRKLSDDSGRDIPEALLRATNLLGKNSIFSIGPDLTMGVFQRGATAGVVNVRYLWDTAAKSSFQGNTLWVSFTLARLTQ